VPTKNSVRNRTMELETSALDEKIAKENPEADDRALADDGRGGGAARPAIGLAALPSWRRRCVDAGGSLAEMMNGERRPVREVDLEPIHVAAFVVVFAACDRLSAD
jgi:hypothetical protein